MSKIYADSPNSELALQDIEFRITNLTTVQNYYAFAPYFYQQIWIESTQLFLREGVICHF